MTRRFVWLSTLLVVGVLAFVLVVAEVLSAEEEAPVLPTGRSIQRLEGLKTVLIVPESRPADRPLSLVVVLHPAAGPASNMADTFDAWPAEGYVVCAPQAKDLTWEVGDLDALTRLVPGLVEALSIDPARVHLVGYSDGGTHLDRVAFDDAVKPCSATWVAATYTGNRVPRWAREELGALALLGADDEQLRQLEAGMERLEGKVRSVECRVAENVGHRFPYDERPYLLWWMGIQEKRITKGHDLSLPWTEDLDTALASQAGEKKGGVFLWVYGDGDAESEDALAVQRDVFLDGRVRFLASQLACVRLDASQQAGRLASFDVTSAPALVVLDTKGRVVKSFTSGFSPRKVAAALKKVAPRRKPPR